MTPYHCVTSSTTKIFPFIVTTITQRRYSGILNYSFWNYTHLPRVELHNYTHLLRMKLHNQFQPPVLASRLEVPRISSDGNLLDLGLSQISP